MDGDAAMDGDAMDRKQGGRSRTAPMLGSRLDARWNAACSYAGTVGIRPRSSLRGVALALAFALGCDTGDGEDTELRRLDAVVAARSARAVGNKTNLAGLAELLFSATPALVGQSREAARATAVAELVSRLGGINFKECTPQITSDPIAGSVDAVFEGCRAGPFRVEGDAHATVEIETTPCPTGECASALSWTLHDFDVLVGPDDARPHFTGDVVLRDEIRPAGQPQAPMSWTTQPGFAITNPLGVFETISHASWTVDADRCVDMRMESRLERIDVDAEDPHRRIRTIVVAVDGLRRCPLRCPEAGDVQISFGAGALLEWSYANTDEVEVAAPGGRTFVQPLLCFE